MAAGGIAENTDALRVGVVLTGVRPQPAEHTLTVFQCCREWCFRGETVIDRHGHETQLGKVDDVARNAKFCGSKTRLVSFKPAAAMNDDDHRPRLAPQV